MMGKSLHLSDYTLPPDQQQQTGDEFKMFWKKIYACNRT